MAYNVDRNDARSTGLMAGGWTNVVLGILVALVPFFTAESGAAFWNNIIVGLLVAILAGYNAWAARNAAGSAAWVGGVNVLLGIWLVISPFVFVTGGFHFWADVILGILIALVAGFNAWAGASRGNRYAGRPGV